ncbi:MAG: TylF/MycF/NovP-related O-methyltransferase [Pirellulales bacterium]
MATWFNSPWFQRLGGGALERLAIGTISAIQLRVLAAHKDPQTLRLIRDIRRQRRSLVTAYEAYTIHSLAKAQCRLEGELAEVGVYEGGTARVICEVKGARPLHLFDTFAGLPTSSAADRAIHRENQFACSLDSVRAYLQPYPGVEFHVGRFPESAAGLEDRRFSFAHFDVDLYESTRGCLEWFYPRMVSGGVMISHDYSVLSGVKQAFTEFLADKPEDLVELPSTQCLVIKR